MERFNRTLAAEWAYAKPYTNEAERNAPKPTRPGCITTITTDPTPGSAVRPPQRAFSTSRGSTAIERQFLRSQPRSARARAYVRSYSARTFSGQKRLPMVDATVEATRAAESTSTTASAYADGFCVATSRPFSGRM